MHPEIQTLKLQNGFSDFVLGSVLNLQKLLYLKIAPYSRRSYFNLYAVKSHQLHTLDLSGSRLREPTTYLSILMTCKESLQILNISKCTNVVDDTLLKLFRICGRKLLSLDISSTSIKGENLSEYNGTLPFIDNLSFDICQQLSKDGMQKILSICGANPPSLRINYEEILQNPSTDDKKSLLCLQHLSLANCGSFTEKGLRKILQICGRTLKKLDISFTQITGETLSEGNGIFLNNMEELDLNHCDLTDIGLKQILQLCSRALKSLNLSYTYITGETLAEGTDTSLVCLENLNLEWCTQLTDTAFVQTIQLCGRTLKSLDISYTNITLQNLTEYDGTLPCIEHLILKGCRQLTDIGLIQLLQLPEKKLKSLRI